MQVPSHASSSTNSKPARKGSTDSALQAADSAFGRPSTLSLDSRSDSVPAEHEGRERLRDSFVIRIERIVPDPQQPRQVFDEDETRELVASIRERGVKQPLTVRWVAEMERYMVVDGGRRYAAAKLAGFESLPCWVQRVEGREVLLDQIIHNWQRVNLRPFETADALARLRDEHGLSQKELVKMTGKPKGEISKLLALHDKVVPEVQEMAREDVAGKLTKRHLYNISKLPPEEQPAVAKRVQRNGMTAMETEKMTSPKAPKRRPGLAARQRRFHTDDADVVVTFRKAHHSDDDARRLFEHLLHDLDASRPRDGV